jgi:uncharacterized phosphosugar-binding protein
MLQTDYLAKVRELIDRLETTQAEAVNGAAESIAAALAHGQGFFISPMGHGNEGDLLGRAGGMMALRPFNYGLSVDNPISDALRDRPRGEEFDADLDGARYAVRAGQMRAGDCLLVGSVSGRTPRAVSIAMAAREVGVTVIAVTSMEYTAGVKPQHPSGKRLCDVADIVLDNCAPYGDACMDVHGLSAPVFPLSGLGTTMICWMLCAQVMEKLLERGLRPHVYLSVNREGGEEFNRVQLEGYNGTGY